MNNKAETDAWRRQWQNTAKEADNAILARDIEERVKSQARRRKYSLILPGLVVLVIGGSLLLRALQTRQPADIALAVEGWIFILVTACGSLWIARGTWKAYGETTAAFLELSIRRCQANLSAIPFGLWLYVGQFFIEILLLLQYSSASPAAVFTSWPVILFGAIGFPALLVASYWFARKQRAELKQLQEMQRQLIDD